VIALPTPRRLSQLCALFALACARQGTEPSAHATVPPPPSAARQPHPANPDETPPHVRTTPHPAVATVTAALSHNERRDEATCRAVTGFAESGFDRCAMTLLANGTAVSVDISYDCGEHACSTESFVWYGDDAAPYRLTDTAPLEVTPDHRFLLVSQLVYTDEVPYAPVGGQTLRIDRKTGKREPFFDCFSAVLSPQSRYYVCRDIDANVLRVSVKGGRPELFARATLPPDERVKLGGPFGDYPAPVRFLSPRELEYEVFQDNSGDVVEYRAAWEE
jgi:hypothetical protein